MRVCINTVFEEVYSDDAKEVVLPGDDGELSLMDYHQSAVLRLTKGNIRIISHRGTKYIPIIDGIAYMDNNALSVMAEVP